MTVVRLLNMTDRSLGELSKCKVEGRGKGEATDAGSAVLVIVSKRFTGSRAGHWPVISRPLPPEVIAGKSKSSPNSRNERLRGGDRSVRNVH